MIASKSLLHDIVYVSKFNLLAKNPNGFSAKINKIGNLQLSNSLTLFNVSIVLSFIVNFLSVHKLCIYSTCEVFFTRNNGKIQDLQSKESLDIGRASRGLYYLDYSPPCNILNKSNSKTRARSVMSRS